MNSSYQLHCEALESRRLLAGNVTAEVVNGDLFLRGDGDANDITIDQDGLPQGSLRLSGLVTSLNGEYPLPLVVSGIQGHVRIFLGDGNNRLRIQDANLIGGLEIQTGVDDDTLIITRSIVTGDYLSQTRRGVDSVYITASVFRGAFTQYTGRGADVVSVDRSGFEGNVDLQTRIGWDSIAIGRNDFAGPVSVDAGTGRNLTTTGAIVRLNYDFANGEQDWLGGFSNYPVDLTGYPDFDFQSGQALLPAELDSTKIGFVLGGSNFPDHLFMYMKRGLGAEQGLIPNQRYQISFDITFASDAPSGGIGIGGPPGEAVHLVAGAGAFEPLPVIADTDSTPEGYWRINFALNDELYQSYVTHVGHIGNGLTGIESSAKDGPYVSLRRVSVHPPAVTADANGKLWVVVGTGSGYEGRTVLYYQNISVTLVPLASRPEI